MVIVIGTLNFNVSTTFEFGFDSDGQQVVMTHEMQWISLQTGRVFNVSRYNVTKRKLSTK